MGRPAGFIIRIPTVVSVAVRGEDMTVERAEEIARYYRDVSLQPSEMELEGFNSVSQGEGPMGYTDEVTEVSIEDPEDGESYDTETLEADDEADDVTAECECGRPVNECSTFDGEDEHGDR